MTLGLFDKRRPGTMVRSTGAALAAMFIASTAFAAPATPPAPTDALALLKAMSDYVGAQKDIAFTYDTTLEIVTADLDKYQLASSGTVRLSRPDKLRATRTGGFADVEMLFDGDKLSLYGKNRKVYVEMPAPAGSIDEFVDKVRAEVGIQVPGADLLLADIYGQLGAPVTSARHLGSGIIGGVECEHLAFRTETVNWEIWIRANGDPIPCRYVITSKQMAQAPQYAIQIANWKTGADAGSDDFKFSNPADAVKVDIGDLDDFDDVPAGLTDGGKP